MLSYYIMAVNKNSTIPDQVRMSVICNPRNLVLLTLPTAVSLMRSGVWMGWLKSAMIFLVLSKFRVR